MAKQIVKICGLKEVEAANVAVASGANLLGTILVPNRARTVDLDVAKEIVQVCKRERLKKGSRFIDSKELLNHAKSLNSQGKEWFSEVSDLVVENGPYLVGVFRNQTLEEVQSLVEKLQLDIVQLHGSENFKAYIDALNVPVIPRYVLNKEGIEDASVCHRHLIPLLDSEVGGEGNLINWDDACTFGSRFDGRYILAGGLTPENVAKALQNEGCLGVDVSGGVETDGVKDLNKIQAFVRNAGTR